MADHRAPLYEAIARPSGGLCMVAIDARESMRGLFRDAARPDSDSDLSAFKQLVAREMAPLASALLCDPRYGQAAMQVLRDEHPATGLIVAVDRFDEPRYGPLRESTLDEDAMALAVAAGGVSALKLYLYWRPEAEVHFREDDARRFVDQCRDLGVLALLEGVVTGPVDDPTFNDSLIRAAEQMGASAPDVYKTQVPTFGRADDETIERESRRLSDAVGVPWVVLSNGVDSTRFPGAVAAACRGGASGVLAGRGVWRAALSSPDPTDELKSGGRARLQELNDIVDHYARPWSLALGG